jgi:Fungal protein kinase
MPIAGSKVKRKPDLVLVHLIDGCIRQGTLHWHDIQTLVEHTHEVKPPMQMLETVLSKSYQIFCSQPKRDFIITLCITGEGFHIVVADHSGVVETDVIKITQYISSVLIRMVMGLTFFPDSFLGVDTTIIHRELEIASSTKFQEEYSPYPYKSSAVPFLFLCGPHTVPLNPLAITKTPAAEGFDKNLSTITIGNIVYQVICIIFSAKSFIGHVTRVFLV